MKNKLLLGLLIGFCVLGFAAGANAGTVTLPNPLCTDMATPCVPSSTCICGFPDLISRIADYVTTLIAGLAVIMFIYAGILFLTSAGNEGKVGQAKKAVFWGIIGVAIALAGKGLIEVIKAVLSLGPTP